MKISKGTQIRAKLSALIAIVASAAMTINAASPFTVTNLPASEIAAESAQLNGVVNPSGKKARYMFQTRKPGAKRFLRATPWTTIPKGQFDVPASGDLTGLQPETAYEYRLVAMRGVVRKVSAVLTFTTAPRAPIVETGPASGIGNSVATVSGTVSPNAGEAAVAYFEYGTTTSYGNVTPTTTVNADGTVVTQDLTGLAPDTEYHYRLVATNSGGASFGEDRTFRTTVNSPTVATQPATGVNATTATLNGTVNPNGGATTARFEYGTTESYGNLTDPIAIPAGNSAVPVSAVLNNLTPNTTYHFRVVASNAGGTSTGADLTFFTQPVVAVCTEEALRTAMQYGGTVRVECDGVITVANEIAVNNSVTLDGTGHTATISGGNTTRVFNVGAGAVFGVNNVTIANGFASSGGAIINDGGTVNLSNATLSNNRATTAGGAIANVNGTVSATACVFSGNTVAAVSTVEMRADAFGGAIFNDDGGAAVIVRSTFANNVVTGGHAVGNEGFVLNGGNAEGGAIHNEGVLAVSESSFSGNSAVGGNGTTPIQPVAPVEGQTGTDGGAAAGGAISHRGLNARIETSTIANNTCTGGAGGAGTIGGLSPGALRNGGTGGTGGGAAGAGFFAAGGPSDIVQSLLANNTSTGGAGGAGGPGGQALSGTGGAGGTGGTGGDSLGGALYVEGGACNVTNSTLAHNAIVGGAGGAAGAGASGVCAVRFPGNGGNGGNGGSGSGAAIYSALGPVSAVHSTIASNTAVAGAGAPGGASVPGDSACGQAASQPGSAGANGSADGAVVTVGIATRIISSIVAYSQVANQNVGPIDAALSRTSIFSDASAPAINGNQLNTNPLLGPLGDNGGLTFTMALLNGSPAIDAADPDPVFTSPVDQRGIARPQGLGPDIGAFEKN